MSEREAPAFEFIGPNKMNITERTRLYLQRPVKESDEIPTSLDDNVGGVQREKLGQWMATGICGNNITSSALYVVALCSVPAGKYAPIALLIIAGLLYLFRTIYEEVVTALPVNGGTYNLLLNTTTKGNASIAACLTMLSYVTTAVISATSAMRYLQTLFESPEQFDVLLMTALTIALAAMLNLIGISESAAVALGIFSFHMLSMAILIVACLWTALTAMPTVNLLAGTSTLVSDSTGVNANVLSAVQKSPTFHLTANAGMTECSCHNFSNSTNATISTANFETVSMLTYNWMYTEPSIGMVGAIFFGFSSALLGVSGFESSSNFVENQAEGVFPLTLRNMWTAVAIINPSIAFLSQCVLPVSAIAGQAEEGALLSIMARIAAGPWLQYIIVVDAATVLIGATITAFVGFTGLVHRMTVDRCLPQAFLRVNNFRKTRHWIINGFWALTTALVFLTEGNVEVLAGVYTIAFLSVMFCFAIGNMLLKVRRSELPTPVHVKWSVVIVAAIAMFLGLLGNIMSRPRSLEPLLIFGALFIIPVQLMLNRRTVLSILIAITASNDTGPQVNRGAAKKMKNDPQGQRMEERNRLDGLFMEAMKTASRLLDADRATLWLVDSVNEELWSKVAVGIPSIRVPLGVGIVGVVTKSCKTLNIPDAYADERFNPAVDKKTGYKTNTILCMPITNDRAKLVGVMQMINKNGKNAVFSTEDELILQDFCNRIAHVVENIQQLDADPEHVLEHLRKELEMTKFFGNLVRSTSLKVQLDNLLGHALRMIRGVIFADRMSLWMVNHLDREVSTQIAENIEPVSMKVSEGFVGWVATQGEALNIQDAQRDPRFFNKVDQTSGYETKHILAIPIFFTNTKNVVAVAQAVNKVDETGNLDVGGFSKHDLQIFQDFMKNVSCLVESMCEPTATTSKLEESIKLLTLHLAAINAKKTNSFHDLFESSLFWLSNMSLEAQRCTLWLVDENKRELFSCLDSGSTPISMESGIIGTCAKDGKILVVNDASKDARVNKEREDIGLNTESLLCAPIFDPAEDGKVLGVVQIINKSNSASSSPSKFDLHDCTVSRCFAHHIAAAIKSYVSSNNEHLQANATAFYRFQLNWEAIVAKLHIIERDQSSEYGTSLQKIKTISRTRNSEILVVEEGSKTIRTNAFFQRFSMMKKSIHEWASRQLRTLTQKPVVYFTKDDSPKALANAVRYVLANEQRIWIKFVRVYERESDIPEHVPDVYQYILDSHPQLIIEYVAMVGTFGPRLVRELSMKEHISSTFMFMGSFGESFKYTFTEMGGLRLITDNIATYHGDVEKKELTAVDLFDEILRKSRSMEELVNDDDHIVVPRSSTFVHETVSPRGARKGSFHRATEDVILHLEMQRSKGSPSLE